MASSVQKVIEWLSSLRARLSKRLFASTDPSHGHRAARSAAATWVRVRVEGEGEGEG